MKRFIIMLVAVDWAIVKRDLIRCADHPYRSLFWRLAEWWVALWIIGITIGVLTGVVHITIH